MEDLNEHRKRIDRLDDKILDLLAERVKLCHTIGEVKKAQNLPVQDKKREQQVYKRIWDLAMKLELNPLQVEMVYREIVNMCSSVQESKEKSE